MRPAALAVNRRDNLKQTSPAAIPFGKRRQGSTSRLPDALYLNRQRYISSKEP
jgi:hypothetical protein